MMINRTIKGFTLTELMVVVGIIVILTAVTLVNLNGSRGKARDAQRVSDVGQLQLALQLYYDRCNQFPSTLSSGATSTSCPSGVTFGTFISQIPTPPAGASQSTYDYATLTISSKIVNYVIRAVLEQNNVATAKGYTGTPPAGGGSWSTTLSCTANTVNYCVTSN